MSPDPRFRSQVSTSITAIPPAVWDGLFPPIAESYSFFKTLEETGQHQFKTFYIVIYEGTRPVVLAPFFVMDYPLDTTIEGTLKTSLNWFEKILGKKITLRVLICGCTAAEGRLGIADVNRNDLAYVLLSEMESLARKEKIPLLAFKDFPDDYLPVFRPLLRRGLHKIPSYPSVVLDIPYLTFDEYLARLSKATRKDLRRKFQDVERLPPVTFEVTNDLGALLDEAYPLYLNTLQKSDVQFERLSKDFFSRISRNMPGETRYFLWRVDNRLVAFDLCLVRGDTLVDEYIGMDYTTAYDYHLYYVTFRDIVTWCIHHDIKKYESGALNYDPKKRLDFRFVPHAIYAKHLNPLMNVFIALLGQVIKPENFDPILKNIGKPKPAPHSPHRLTVKIVLFMLLADVTESAGELLFKKAVLATGIDQVVGQNFLTFLFQLLAAPQFWFGVLIYLANFVLWMAILSRLDLSVAFPIGNATFIIIPFLSMFALHEKISLVRWLGAACILIGVTLISRSTGKENPAP